jgi:predicted glycosyltransferase involved in capsule biosynthesis
MTLWAKLLEFLGVRKRQVKISIIIPFTSKDWERVRNFKWLLKYWENQLPHAEIIIGKSSKGIFCKGRALNRAVRKSHGKIVAILDADALLKGEAVEYCADKILEEEKRGHNLWFIPYRHLSRLNKHATKLVVHSDPSNPFIPHCPPPKTFIDTVGHSQMYGYRYCAMAAIFPRRAYDMIGGFDERFRGWGSEDIALMRTLDTVFGKHKTIKGCIFHLFHPYIGENYLTRKWEGQDTGNVNAKLSNRYFRANRNPSLMWELILEEKFSNNL